MSGEEVFPGRDLASFGSWSNAVPPEDVSSQSDPIRAPNDAIKLTIVT
jgi:hypothetical protein